MANNNYELETIRSYIDIYEIVSEHVVLKKSGLNYWGLCPFHHEKTPSFSVNRDKNIFKCFGCGAGGDAFSFLMRVKGISFYEVMQELAIRYGVNLSYTSSEETSHKKELLKVNEAAKQFFCQSLLEDSVGKQALNYIYDRGFDTGAVKKFQLGYAPGSWDAFVKHCTHELGLNMELVEQAGLVQKRENAAGYYDKFRNRFMIPIFDENHNTLGFGGRVLSDQDQPKYLNSPETTVFHKSKVLYGLNFAKESVKQQDAVVIMEGYFDVIRAMSHGLDNVVATLGTALSSNHLKILSKYTVSKKIILAFDKDFAGKKATERGLEIIQETFDGLNHLKLYNDAVNGQFSEKPYQISILAMPYGKDPDDFIQDNGVNKFKELLESSVPVVEYQIQSIIDDVDLNNPVEKDICIQKIVKILYDIRSPIIREEYVNYAARQTGVRSDVIAYEIKRYLKSQKYNILKEKSGYFGNTKDPARFTGNGYRSKLPKYMLAEKKLLGLYFLDIHTNLYISQKLETIEFIDSAHKKLKYYIEQTLKEGISSIEKFKDNLMTRVLGEEELINLASDILYNLDEQNSLKPDQLDTWVDENIRWIESFKAEQSVKNSECELEAQKKVKELIEHRKKLIGTTKTNLE